MHRLIPLVAALALFVPATARAIDCAKAASPTEKLICATPTLKQLDAVLNQDYFEYLNKFGFIAEGTDPRFKPDPDAPARRQQEWLDKERDVCADVACLEEVYKKRIQELSGATDVFVRHVAPEWDVIVSLYLSECDWGDGESGMCGNANLDVFAKDTGVLFQRIQTQRFNTAVDIKADDFNFDGHSDLVFSAGFFSAGSSEAARWYDKWYYDIYLYDPVKRVFALSKEFSDIMSRGADRLSVDGTKNRTIADLEAFLFVDAKNKTLTRYKRVSAGSGCEEGHEHYIRVWRTYKVRGNAPVLVRDVREDTGGCGADDGSGNVVTTTRTLVDGKWRETTKHRVYKLQTD